MDGSLYNAVVKADGADGPPLKANGTYIFKQKMWNWSNVNVAGSLEINSFNLYIGITKK